MIACHVLSRTSSANIASLVRVPLRKRKGRTYTSYSFGKDSSLCSE